MPDNQTEREKQLETLSKLLKDSKRERSPYYTLKASRKRTRLIANLFRRAYNDNSIVIFRNPFTPTEIFYALDMVPLCLEAFASMFAGSNLCKNALKTAEDNHYSRDTCSFIRFAMGASIDDFLPTPDFLVCTTHYCDAGSKAFDILSKRYKKDYFFLDVPYNYETERGIDYLAKQIEEMTNFIAKKINKKINLDKLAETIDLSNQAREYFLKANELRRHIPAPMRGSEAIDFAAIVAYTWGSKDAVEIYKILYEELKERVENNIGTVDKELYRVLWRHLRPYYSNFIMDYLENHCKAVVAFEEVNYIHWPKMDPAKPYQSLARKILSNNPIGPFKHWQEGTLDIIEKYNIDGVISFSHWGCKHVNSSTQLFKNLLHKRSLPLLELNCDCIDQTNYSIEQIRTRIDAFIELLSRKQNRH